MAEKVCYQVDYSYDRDMMRAFCRVHLWYYKRQHPLFLKMPGLFLVLAVAVYVLKHVIAGPALTGTQMVQVLLIGVFSFFLMWMGFVSPRVFENTMLKNLEDPKKLAVSLTFYQRHLLAVNALSETDISYDKIAKGYVTDHYLFLYMPGGQALIVPYSAVKEPDREAFQSFIRERLGNKIIAKKYAEVFL